MNSKHSRICVLNISMFVSSTVFVYSMSVLSHMTPSLIIAFKLMESFSVVICPVTDNFQGTCSFGKVRTVYITVQFSIMCDSWQHRTVQHVPKQRPINEQLSCNILKYHLHTFVTWDLRHISVQHDSWKDYTVPNLHRWQHKSQ